MDASQKELSQKIGTCFAEAMGSVFSMLTGRDFAITPREVQTPDPAGIAGLHPGTAVYVKAQYTKGVNGALFFVLPVREGTMLVDLMLGGEGTPADDLAGDSRDALAETFNQSMGSANQTLSDWAGETLSISNVDISTAGSGDASAVTDLVGPGPFLMVPMGTVQDSLDTTIHVVLPDALVQQLVKKLGLGAPEPAPEPEPLAPPPPPPAAAAPVAASMPGAPRAAAAPIPMAAPVDQGNLDLLLDIELPLMVRMGQTEMQLGELLKLTPGSILELNRAADAPVELLVNGKQIAKGEVVVVDGNFAFRITEIESAAARIRSLG